MTQRNAITRQIIALAKLPDAQCQLEIERELHDHLEDLADDSTSRVSRLR